MAVKTSAQETRNALAAVFEKHQAQRICVLGTICCGKTTLLRQLPGCVDLDDLLWPALTEEEAAFASQTPWTPEVGRFIDQVVYQRIRVEPGRPLFTTIIVDCDVVVYLDLSDALLERHCLARGCSFADAKNVKAAVEADWNAHRAQGGKTFYYFTLTE